MPKIIFSEKDHRYFSSDGEEYLSISKAYKKFETPFDADAIAKKKALIDMFPNEYKTLKKTYKYDDPRLITALEQLVSKDILQDAIDKLKQDWEAKGEKSRSTGTNIHALLETADLNRGFVWSGVSGSYQKVINPPKTHDNESLADNLYDLEDGYYPELLIFDPETKKAGQADGVFIKSIGSSRNVYIKDYKSDLAINYKPQFFDWKKGYEKLLGPLNHLTACNMNQYSVKMSAYGVMLEKFGFNVQKLQIQSLRIDTDGKLVNIIPINIPYRKHEAEIILHF